MYKLKYYSLNKNQKSKIKEEFFKTEFGKSIDHRLKRLNIIGILSILFSIFLIVTSQTKWEIIYGIILAIGGIVFIIGAILVRIDKINAYLINKR